MNIRVFFHNNVIEPWDDIPDFLLAWFLERSGVNSLDFKRHLFNMNMIEQLELFSDSVNYNRKNRLDFNSPEEKVYSYLSDLGLPASSIKQDEATLMFEKLDQIGQSIILMRKRKYIWNEESLKGGWLSWQCNRSPMLGETVGVQTCEIIAQVLGFERKSLDRVYGPPPWEHNVEYYLFVTFRLFGFSLSMDCRSIDVRKEVLAENIGAQRMSEQRVQTLTTKNKGKKIRIKVQYEVTAGGFKRNPEILETCIPDIINQLDIKF